MQKAKGIVNIQIGRCGNQIGTKFWETIANEHGIEPDGTYKGDSPLRSERNKYAPRTVLIDSEPRLLEAINFSRYGKIFRLNNFLFCISSNYTKGYCVEEMDVDMAMDIIRREAEISDGLQGFQFMYSLGGGTGSRLGSLLITKIREEYPKRTLSSFSMFPTTKLWDALATEPYNATLSAPHLIENIDETFCIDNEALRDISLRTLRLTQPLYSDFNHIASMAISGVTSLFRFPGQLNADLHELAINMIPLPKLHFLMFGCTPLTTRNAPELELCKTNDLIQQLFDMRHMMAAYDPRNGRYLAASAVFRGPISMEDLESEMSDVRMTMTPKDIPKNIKLAIRDIPTRRTKNSAISLFNTTAIREIFSNIRTKYEAIFHRKKNLHWYESEGMSEAEFIEADNTIKDIIAEYQQIDDGNWNDKIDNQVDNVELTG
ncbi:Tubulin beta-1 chain [Dirofilaria immitis]